jgi:hypothetical protein
MKRINLDILVKVNGNNQLKSIKGYQLDFDPNLAIHRSNEFKECWTITDMPTGLSLYTRKGTRDIVVHKFRYVDDSYKNYNGFKEKSNSKYRSYIERFNELKNTEERK